MVISIYIQLIQKYMSVHLFTLVVRYKGGGGGSDSSRGNAGLKLTLYSYLS